MLMQEDSRISRRADRASNLLCYFACSFLLEAPSLITAFPHLPTILIVLPVLPRLLSMISAGRLHFSCQTIVKGFASAILDPKPLRASELNQVIIVFFSNFCKQVKEVRTQHRFLYLFVKTNNVSCIGWIRFGVRWMGGAMKLRYRWAHIIYIYIYYIYIYYILYIYILFIYM